MARPSLFSSCLAVALLLLWAAAPGLASQIGAGDLLPKGPHSAPAAQDGPPHPRGDYLLGRTLSLGDSELLSTEMIRDENRHKLELFTISRETIIPLASAHLYIVHQARVSQIKRGKVEELRPEETPPPPWNVKHAPKGMNGWAEGLDQVGKLRGLLQNKPLPDLKRWSPLSWLTEEDGLLSGRPWSWENFMPRLLTVAGLVLGGLFLVEALRVLLAMGSRVVGDKDRPDRS